MSSSNANMAGLASARQQADMKSILAGTWPPLKPLPLFKYETVAYRAAIEFDKLRGEWVCRKTSFPSNSVQELRGGLREITMALPHGDAKLFGECPDPQEQESQKDTNRRLQAIQDWRENSESGARYFELREYLSESQRTEIDDSLRLSLTARQLQFNAKNVAYVFEALSTAGGRFATLIEFAKRNKAKLGPAAAVREQGTESEREIAIDHHSFPPEVNFRELVLNDHIPLVRHQEAAEPCADEFPVLSIKDVLPERDPSLCAHRMEHTTSQEFEIEPSEVVDVDSESLVEQSCHEHHSSLSLPVLEISVFQVVAFALLLLFSVAAFTIGLTAGRGPLGRRLLWASKATSAADAKASTGPEPADESILRTPVPQLASSNEANKVDAATKTTDSRPAAKPEATSEHGHRIEPIVTNASPPAISTAVPSRRAAVPMNSSPKNLASYEPTRKLAEAPHLSRPSAILVNVPIRGSQPIRVSFPERAIAATSSLTMTSQLSVLLSPELRPLEADKPARLEAGRLVSFVWPRYPKPADRCGAGELIRVRARIAPLGQVREVHFLSGSRSLLPATTRAIRQWRYTPTLLDKRPVQAQQDLTIEFRPPQYSAQASGPHQSHN